MLILTVIVSHSMNERMSMSDWEHACKLGMDRMREDKWNERKSWEKPNKEMKKREGGGETMAIK